MILPNFMSLSWSYVIPHSNKMLRCCPTSRLVHQSPHVAQIWLQFAEEESWSCLYGLCFCSSLNQSPRQKEWDRLTNLCKVVPTTSEVRLESIPPKACGCYPTEEKEYSKGKSETIQNGQELHGFWVRN